MHTYHAPKQQDAAAIVQCVSRRRFLALSAATAGAALLAACGGTTTAPTPTAAPAAAASPPPTQAPITVPTTAANLTAAAASGTAPTARAASAPSGAPTVQVASAPSGVVPTTQAAAGKPGGMKICRTGYANDPNFMDPAKITGGPDYQLAEAIFNYIGRYTYNPPLGTDIKPELAQWEIKDNAKTYIFHLQKGVKFHGGNGELTADDVKWNWDRIKDPKTASRYATDFAGSTITALDPYTVQVTFDHPYPGFIPASLAFRPGFIISPTAFQALGDNWKTHPIGTGPFMWDSWQPGAQATLKRNPDYWGTKPKLDQIVYKLKVDDRSAVLAVAKGELDAVYLTDPDVSLTTYKNPDPNTIFYKSDFGQGPYWLAYNMKKKPFDDVRVRQALRYAIDINSIAKDLFGGLADPIHSFLPPFMFGYSNDITKFTYNPDKAKQMLKDANVPQDFSPDVIGDGSSTAARKVHEAVGSFWADVGVKAKISMLDSGTFQQRRNAGEYDIFGISVTRIDPDQIATPYWHTGSTVNNSFYAGADDLIDKAKAEPDPMQRAKLYRDLQDKVSQDSPAAFIVAYSDHLLINKRVGGISGDGWQDRFDWFNVDVPAE